MTASAAQLRHRMRLERRILWEDGEGGLATQFEPVATLWAGAQLQAVRRQAALGAPREVRTWRIQLRKGPEPAAGWRLIWQGRTLSVRHVRPLQPGEGFQSLIAEEEVAL